MTGQLAVGDRKHGDGATGSFPGPGSFLEFRHLMQPPAWLLVAVESLANHLLLPQLELASNRSSFELCVPPLKVWLVMIVPPGAFTLTWPFGPST